MSRIRKRLLIAGLGAGLTFALSAAVGCFPQETKTKPDTRAQADDFTADPNATIGSRTVMGNTDPIPVSGVGLVYMLKGTGSSPAPGGWRDTLEKSLQRQKISTKEMLDDQGKTTSLVLLSGMINPGARRGDKFDLTITLPQGSKTTSLKHGVLWDSDLTNYAMTGNIRQAMSEAGLGPNKVPANQAGELIIGSKMATGKGPLTAGTIVPDGESPQVETGGDKEPQYKVAKVWDGGTNLLDRPYHFLINESTAQPRLAMVIASRLNTVFHGTSDKSGKVAEASVRGRPLVTAFVPPGYRLNHQRFLMAARQVPLTPVTQNDPYFKKLAAELLQPESAVTASIKLEGVGADSEAALRTGLESDADWVKFASAQSLCYLGKADKLAASILGNMAVKHPALRTHCLTALASQDDAQCVAELVELMKSKDPALRYGAFVALRSANEHHEAIRGRLMGGSFWMHTVAGDSEPLVHLSTEKRNEIVLFGDVWPLAGEFAFPLGSEFTVTRKGGDDKVLISRVVTKDGEPTTVTGQYRADLLAVLKGLSEMSGTYADAVEFIRQTSKMDVLACKLAIDISPRGIPIQDLAQMARRDPTVGESDKLAMKGHTTDDIQQAGGFDLQTEADAVKKKAPPQSHPLNRNPGSIFGGK